MNELLRLAQSLLSRPSVTPDDAGCQLQIADFLQPLGFSVETLQYGDVTNLWASGGQVAPKFVFAGHTDVVPPGPLAQWTSDPFTPTVRDGKLFARGVVDMKAAIAAMLIATKNHLGRCPTHREDIGFLITSDEEGPAIGGTEQVMETLQQRGIQFDYCLIGEPTSSKITGDTLRVGRRGSLSATLIIRGIQGHIAYPQLAKNPIHLCLAALQSLVDISWDNGNKDFPPTSIQLSTITAGEGISNVIPGEISIDFNFRYSPEVTAESLQAQVTKLLESFELDFTLDWRLSALPFYSGQGQLLEASLSAIKSVTGLAADCSTAGGTSDGRFIAPYGIEVIELGLCNQTAHQIDESAPVNDIEQLAIIYENLLDKLLS